MLTGLPQGADPSPPPLNVATGGKNLLNEEIKLPPSSPLGQASDIAKPYQIWDMQRSCADMNSPYKRKCWANSGGPLVNSLLWGDSTPPICKPFSLYGCISACLNLQIPVWFSLLASLSACQFSTSSCLLECRILLQMTYMSVCLYACVLGTNDLTFRCAQWNFWGAMQIYTCLYKKNFFPNIEWLVPFWTIYFIKVTLTLLWDENCLSLNRLNEVSKNPSFHTNFKNVHLTLVKSAPQKCFAQKNKFFGTNFQLAK